MVLFCINSIELKDGAIIYVSFIFFQKQYVS